MFQLRFANNAKPPIWLVSSKYAFGSAQDCDCVLTQQGVEALHAKVTVEDETVLLVRIAEHGIIKVNQQNVGKQCQLKPGDNIQLGEAELQVVDPKLESSSTTTTPNNDSEVRDKLTLNDQASDLWLLCPLNTTLVKENITLAGSMSLGRAKDCDICIGASHLSRKHAKFVVLGQSLTVEDLASSNGTFVNGERVERIVLKHGDELGFDTLKFRIEKKTLKQNITTPPPLPSLDETQVRPAISLEAIKAQQEAASRAPKSVLRPSQQTKPVHKNTTPSRPQINTALPDDRGGIQFLFSAGLVIAAIGFLVWFLLV